MTESLFDHSRPVLLDLFCGAGGASRGYHDAGFAVIGVDIAPQPNYPFTFVQMDALEYLGRLLRGDVRPVPDVIHASPPCQAFTAYRRKGRGVGDGYPDLISPVRESLESSELPYIIENVQGAPLRDPVTLCGSMFKLDVRRHRLFETNWPLRQLPCFHAEQAAKGKRFPGATNRDGRYTVEVGVWRIPLETQRRAMGIDWMTLEELTEAIPPAYTSYVAHELLVQRDLSRAA